MLHVYARLCDWLSRVILWVYYIRHREHELPELYFSLLLRSVRCRGTGRGVESKTEL